MNQIGGTKDPEAEPVAQSLPQPQDTPKPPDKTDSAAVVVAATTTTTTTTEEQEVGQEEKPPVPMEEDSLNPATVFSIRLKQPRSNLLHKMSVPELCRNFRSVIRFNWFGFSSN